MPYKKQTPVLFQHGGGGFLRGGDVYAAGSGGGLRGGFHGRRVKSKFHLHQFLLGVRIRRGVLFRRVFMPLFLIYSREDLLYYMGFP